MDLFAARIVLQYRLFTSPDTDVTASVNKARNVASAATQRCRWRRSTYRNSNPYKSVSSRDHKIIPTHSSRRVSWAGDVSSDISDPVAFLQLQREKHLCEILEAEVGEGLESEE